ncbi:hypothetical protein FKW77_006851 [Venturia effusa]|uniref:Ubiquitin 3 binding protein But2 C-terminal domain-containing protein n=1 Tax=Venturia effusa TaxID=50376 RepID=A0A517LP73_9PEZI|nr:hypothetical protein FKW77_006851 [Venturia effusa]
MKLLSLLSIAGIACALPTPDVPSGPNIIQPSARSIYEVNTGAIYYQSQTGHIFKSSSGNDLTTLLTFDLPSSLQGKTCSFHFYLDSTARAEGTKAFDLYSSLKPATANSPGGSGPGNQRNQFMGRMKAVLGGEATWVPDVFPKTGESFPCPYGDAFGYEVVGSGDYVDIAWNPPASGSYISWS